MSPKEVSSIPYYCVIICLAKGGALCTFLLQLCPLTGHQISYPNIWFETKYLSNLINHSHSHNWLAEVDGWAIANQLEQFLDPGFILQGTEDQIITWHIPDKFTMACSSQLLSNYQRS